MRIGTIGSGSIVRYILENAAETEGLPCEAAYSRPEQTGCAHKDDAIAYLAGVRRPKQ